MPPEQFNQIFSPAPAPPVRQYDVYSNWGNWLYAAGITGGRVNVFNILKQSRDYDAQARRRSVVATAAALTTQRGSQMRSAASAMS